MSCFGFVFSYLLRRSETVDGQRYQILRTVGEGGFSYVYLASKEGRQYAVKKMLLQVPEQWESAKNEIRVHRKVQHDNVVKLVNSEVRDDQPGEGAALLVFPYYHNGTLQDLIDHVQKIRLPLEEKKILQLFLSACRGLKAMHTCPSGPIAHRDIKPGNLLITDEGDELVLMDLGSARDAECLITNRQEALALQELAAQTCTAHYRAPELFEVPSNCTITAKTDVWSLGCSIFAAAFGASPFDGSALAANSGRVVFPKNHSFSDSFCDLIKWILVVDPDERPTVEEVEERIATILNQP